MMMSASQYKPKLVFFQYKYERLAPFLLLHQREHVDCLAQFFDVTVIQHDCDYQQVCDKYQPELVMFESGVPFNTCTRPVVKNVRSNPQVPKVGFLHADGFGEGRTGFLSDMEHWGIETFFTIATTAAEHTPALADKFIVWPNFVNPQLHRDYGQAKTIDILFTGNKNNLYPWRRKMVELLPKYYPSVINVHPGYIPDKETRNMVVGESYARMLNSAWMVPACGAVAKEIVRKHFEVPASRSCLVTEQSAALETAGFVDMKNCVFVDENNAVEKIGYLLEHREELQTITDAGHQLVHSRHTIKHRDQVLQWFLLTREIKPGQKIIQTNPFEPLQVVELSSGRESIHVRTNGGFVSLLHEGGELLWRREYAKAEQKYAGCSSYYRFMPEPLLGLALCKLFQGNAASAMKVLSEPLEATLADYKSIDPDPVEWACFIITLLCQGKVREAARRSKEFEWLRHPELDRVRWILGALDSKPRNFEFPAKPKKYRLTVHQMPARNFEQWTRDLVTMLNACGQQALARKVNALESEIAVAEWAAIPAAETIVDEAKLRSAWAGRVPLIYCRTDARGLFNRRRLYSSSVAKMRKVAKTLLRRTKTRRKNTVRQENQVSRTMSNPRPSNAYCERGA